MISAEQIADIDQTIANAVHAYPGCKFLSVNLDVVAITDDDGDYHIFDTYTRNEMTHICEVCDEFKTDSDLNSIGLCEDCAAEAQEEAK